MWGKRNVATAGLRPSRSSVRRSPAKLAGNAGIANAAELAAGAELADGAELAGEALA